MRNGPGKAHREGITVLELANMFPDEDSARKWFESRIWRDGRKCPKCGSEKTRPASHKKMPYWCTKGRHYFSVRVGTVMEESKVSYRKWVFAIYLHLTNLKGVSSMKLHRDIGVTQTTAWFMLQRIRKAFEDDDDAFGGPVEVDETYVGGRERNKHASAKLRAGRGGVGKAVVVGAKDRATNQVRAQVIPETDRLTLRTFVRENVEPGAVLYTDEAAAYKGEWGYDHEAVKHSVGEYVRGMAHTNGIESFWSMLKRAHKGVYHKISVKHLQRYVHEFAGRHGIRELGTLGQMGSLAQSMAGKRLTYKELIA